MIGKCEILDQGAVHHGSFFPGAGLAGVHAAGARGATARQRAHDHFTQEEMGRRILEIYRKVLDAPPCNPAGIAPPRRGNCRSDFLGGDKRGASKLGNIPILFGSILLF